MLYFQAAGLISRHADLAKFIAESSGHLGDRPTTEALVIRNPGDYVHCVWQTFDATPEDQGQGYPHLWVAVGAVRSVWRGGQGEDLQHCRARRKSFCRFLGFLEIPPPGCM